jgi:hypothetical protein
MCASATALAQAPQPCRRVPLFLLGTPSRAIAAAPVFWPKGASFFALEKPLDHLNLAVGVLLNRRKTSPPASSTPTATPLGLLTEHLAANP